MAAERNEYSTDVLIIGAGTAGLLAARELARSGRRVCIVEAQDRIGGRVHTLRAQGFTRAIEAGAEFMHGEVPLTRALMAEAGMAWEEADGESYLVQGGQLQAQADYFALLPPLLEKLQALAEDMPLADFLTREFPGPQHAALRTFATQFAEGYDAADAQRVSAWAMRDEWAAGGAQGSLRPVGGYGPLLHGLAAQAQAAGALLHLGAPVQEIRWQPGQVEALTVAGATYRARQVLCTVPLGVWQRGPQQAGYLGFVPEVAAHRAAAAQLGFGSVIKIVLGFRTAFWLERLPEMEFLLSDEPVPTWWSQLPAATPQLTGWLAGPAAQRLAGAPDDEVLQLALASLAPLLAVSPEALQAQLCAGYVRNWGREPYAYGAYSYATVGAGAAQAALATPVADTLFFAGEGAYSGPFAGTVEAALVSGQDASRAMLARPVPTAVPGAPGA